MKKVNNDKVIEILMDDYVVSDEYDNEMTCDELYQDGQNYYFIRDHYEHDIICDDDTGYNMIREERNIIDTEEIKLVSMGEIEKIIKNNKIN